MSTTAIALAGMEFLFQLIERTHAASLIFKQAHDEGRQASSAELQSLRAHLDASLTELDQAIERAKTEGR